MEKNNGAIVDDAFGSSPPSDVDDHLSSAQQSAIQRNALLFDPSLAQMQQHQQQNEEEEEDENFYKITADDLRMMHKSLINETKKQTALLPTKFVKEWDQHLKQKAYKRTVVRFRLSDGQILQAQFLSTEPVSALFAFVRDSVVTPAVQFELRQIPTGQLHADDATSLLDAGIAPKSVLILKIVSSDPGTNSATGELSAAQFFSTNHCRCCSQAEAVANAEQWLSPNTEFRPYLSTIVDNLPSATDGDRASTTSTTTRSSIMPSSSMATRNSDRNNGSADTTAEDGTSSSTASHTRRRDNSSSERKKTNSPELPKWWKKRK